MLFDVVDICCCSGQVVRWLDEDGDLLRALEVLVPERIEPYPQQTDE